MYQFLVSISGVVLSLLGTFLPKIRRFNEGRVNWRQQLRLKINALSIYGEHTPVVLFHCASVGEFEQARPIIERFHAEFPGHRIVLSFFSPSGYELRKNFSAADVVCYLPLDTRKNMSDFLDLIQPSAVIIIKYEFWPNFLLECHSRNIPVISVSAIFRTDQFYFRPYGSYFLKSLRTIRHFFVQDENSKMILEKSGIENVTVAGDTRFDRVTAIRDQAAPVREVSEFVGETPTMIIGSAWPEDMKVMVPVMQKLQHRMKFIVVPHEVDQSSLDKISSYLSSWIKFSEWKTNSAERVLIVDKIGMLSRLYASGKFAWIGGAYGKGLHNTLEAAVYGMPVFFGNLNYQKFREARELIQEGAAFPTSSSVELEQKLISLLDDPEKLKKLSFIASVYVARHKGATEIVLKYFKNVLIK